MRSITTASDEETRELASILGAAARPGDILALEGPLGAGKTTFVQGFSRGAGFRGSVVSPSFAVARRYRAGRKTIHHLDLYRLAGAEIPNLGLEDYLGDPAGVCLIEWPEAGEAELPKDRLTVRFEHVAETRRSLSFRAGGASSRRLLAAIKTPSKGLRESKKLQ